MSLWKTEIRRGRGHICPVAYAVIVTEAANSGTLTEIWAIV